MIKELIISNFQSHTNTHLTFTNGLNVITGASDSGKTAVLRSLLWLVNNRPSGEVIRNWHCPDKDPVSVTLVLDGGTTIVKNRTNGKSSYIMEDKRYEAIKADVPEEVTTAINLSDLNIQSQHQPYFLLDDSAGEVSKKLNQITGLDIIDHLFVRINSEMQIINTEIKINEREIADLDEKIDELSYLDDAVAKFDRLEKEIKTYKILLDDKALLEKKIKAYRNVDSEKKAIERTLRLESVVKELGELVDEYEACSKDKTRLNFLLTKYTGNKLSSNKLDKTIKTLQEEYDDAIRKNTLCPLLNIKCKELKNYGT